MTNNRVSRRTLLQSGALAAAGSGLGLGQSVGPRAAAPPDQPNVYASIGVRPLINCKGTFTIITGSLTLPEVKKAMDEASRYFVHLDELMEAVGRRLAELTGAEWGIVTAGCAAAMTVGTCACIAGSSPEKIQRLPNLQGLKDEVIIPKHSRNVYDHAIRMVGPKIITVEDMEALERAIGPRTAMVYVLAGPDDSGPFGLEPIAAVARRFAVPVFVDAAAEGLTPEVHLKRGADLVGYSGGKAIRGPQCAGLLLGRKDLCQAAWINSAPHHAFGRSQKVGKEEIIGMVTAVEMWYKRDHAAEWKTWESWLDEISRTVTRVPGVTTAVIQPDSLSNRSPSLEIKWDGTKLGISGQQVFDLLLAGSPRIQLYAFKGTVPSGLAESSVSVFPWMMQPGEARIVADRLRGVLASPPPRTEDRRVPGRANLAGAWDLELQFKLGREKHSLFLEQNGEDLAGLHLGETLRGKVTGTTEGEIVSLRSSQPIEGTQLSFSFRGKVSGDSMEGTVDLGEYGQATWSARRPPKAGS